MLKQNAESGMKAIRLTGELLNTAINEENERTKEDIIKKICNASF
ncbi:hypothetical protein OL548_23805 [Lysinibacillus sp. MHQ-1]|nr:hypothetical protein OL548_23805 [Lysinibacillus sp. MHQ-1]